MGLIYHYANKKVFTPSASKVRTGMDTQTDRQTETDTYKKDRKSDKNLRKRKSLQNSTDLTLKMNRSVRTLLH